MHDFTVWLLTQHPRLDAVGDLARFSARSYSNAPRRTGRLFRWLKWAGEDRVLRGSIKKAHSEWRAVKKGVV